MTGRKIINHWTAGQLKPNATDFEHYHYIIDGKGNVYRCDHSIESNDNTADGNYAAHTGGGNTRRYGVSLCGMMDFKSPKSPGKYKLTLPQTEALYLLNARIAFKEGYKTLNDEILMTHKEFGIKNPNTSSAGKIDICWLPDEQDPSKVGNHIREKSIWYLNNIISGKISGDIKTIN
jgi:hypothetical protein